jgi:Tol biopolymer transport system component
VKKAGLLAVALGMLLVPSSAFASFPGANGRIAYEVATGGTNDEIHSILPNGQGDRVLGPGDEPSWSANGRRIVFVKANPSNNFDIYSMRADGSDVRQVTHDRLLELYPSYSPDGKRIVFQRSTGRNSIVSIRSDGSDQRILEQDAETPVYAPNGKHIAFRSGTGTIAVMRPDGTHAHDVAFAAFSNDSPDYSPNGKRIAFVRHYRKGKLGVFTVPANGGPMHQLGRCASLSPTYSPSGRKMVTGDGNALGITPANGSCPATPLVSGGGLGDPSWQPLPGA